MIHTTYTTNRVYTTTLTSKMSFTSIQDMLQTLVDIPFNTPFTLSGKRDSINMSNHWAGCSYDEAIKYATQGWTPMAQKLAQRITLNQPNTNDKNRAPRPTTSPVGYAPHVPNYLNNCPNAMINHTNKPQQKKIIHLFRNFSYASKVPAAEIEEQGYRALSVIQAIEASGYRVKLSVISVQESGDERHVTELTIKNPDQPLNLSKMAFPLIHSAYFRRIVLRATEKNPGLTRAGWCHGYGTPEDAREEDRSAGSIALPRYIGDIKSAAEQLLAQHNRHK